MSTSGRHRTTTRPQRAGRRWGSAGIAGTALAIVAGASSLAALPALAQGTVPGPPVIGTATPGDASVSVTFDPPSDDGGSPITSYTVDCTSSDGGAEGIASDVGSPISVLSLTNGNTYTCVVTATNDNGTGPASDPTSPVVPAAPTTVPDPPVIGTATAGNATVQVAFTPPGSDGGSPILSYAADCASSNGGAEGTGTAAASPITVTGLTNGHAYACTVTATNANGTSQPSAPSNTVNLSLNQPPVITSASSATFTVGSAGSFTVTTTGFPVPTLAKTGKLPTGVTFVDNHDGTATLAGTVPSGKGGTFPLTLTARNSLATVTQAFTLVAGQAPVIKSGSTVTFTAGTAGSFMVTTAGYPSPSLTEDGALPSGITFTDHGNGTATLAGTADPRTGGRYVLTLTAASSAGTATQTFTLVVQAAPTVTSDPATTFHAGSAGTFTVTTSGYPYPSISKTGKLPSGVTFVDNHDGTATLAGTAPVGKAGAYPLTITVKNVRGTVTQSFTLIVVQPPQIKSSAVVGFSIGVAKSFTVLTTGYPVPSITETGALPDGLTFVDNGDGTATLSGTAAVGSGGGYALTITATNDFGTATQLFSILVK